MPAGSKKQRRFMGAELARKRAGKQTETGMTTQQLRDFAGTEEKGLPKKKNNPNNNSGILAKAMQKSKPQKSGSTKKSDGGNIYQHISKM